MEGPLDTGKVYLVGAGPGDPDLMTVRAHRLLSTARTVVYDRLVSPEILDLIPATAERIYVGKAPHRHTIPQEDINQLLVDLALSGKNVIRLKGGDPFTFGRGGEEALELVKHGVGVEVVPGITSAAGVSAQLGLPLTHRGISNSVRFITGSCQNNVGLDLDWAGLADPMTTLVIYMGLAPINEIVARLVEAGVSKDCPAALVENGTRPEERHNMTTVGELPETAARFHYHPPTLIIIGRVVALQAKLAERNIPNRPTMTELALQTG